MPRSRAPYSLEFRRRIIELVRKGRTPEELAQQFDLTCIGSPGDGEPAGVEELTGANRRH
jgi:hypothetical protein